MFSPLSLWLLRLLVFLPLQSRRIRRATLKEMVDSFKLVGQLEPITLRPIRVNGKTKYKIVDGHRRFRTAKLAGITN